MKGKTWIILLFLALAVVGLSGCPSSDDDELADLVVTVSPNPVIHTVGGGLNRCDFVVRLTNNSDKSITLQGYNAEITDTDTAFTLSGFNAATVGGHVIAAGTFWEYAGWRYDNRFARGTEKRIYTGLRSDGVAVEGTVNIFLR